MKFFFQSYVVSSEPHVQKICTLIPDIDWRMLENVAVGTYTSGAGLGAPLYTFLLSNTVFSWKDLLGINTALFVLSINAKLKSFTNIDTNVEQTISFFYYLAGTSLKF